jgi:uncharacterized RDD family membrane protein YckC
LTRYAGFWSRLAANIVDILVLTPLMALGYWALYSSRDIAFASEIPLVLVSTAYEIYFVGRWGQTVGKKVVGIKVVSVDESAAGYRRAFWRQSVDLALALGSAVMAIVALSSVTNEEFDLLSHHARDVLERRSEPNWYIYLGLAWSFGELLVLLTNKKRRALHDFIAGTVVIHAETANADVKASA